MRTFILLFAAALALALAQDAAVSCMTDEDCASLSMQETPKTGDQGQQGQQDGVQQTQATAQKPEAEQEQTIQGGAGSPNVVQRQSVSQQNQDQGQEGQAEKPKPESQPEPTQYKCVNNKCQKIETATPTVFGHPFTNPSRLSNQRCTLDRQCPPGFKCSWLRGGRCHAD